MMNNLLKNHKYYLIIFLLLVAVAIILSSCGGSDTLIGISPTPTPSFVSKNVEGFIYHLTSTSDSGETVDKFVILDTPAYKTDTSGNDPFLTQIADILQQDSEGQEIYNQLSSELSTWQPLPEFDSSAKLFSIYQDAKSATPLTVDSDGHFKGTVSVLSTDDTVKFEVALSNGNYVEAETIASSDITSSQTITGELKSCPRRILALPGSCTIIKFYTSTNINLKESGLSLSVENPNLGYITQPFYLKIFGKVNYSIGFSVFYAKKGLTTPVDTIIKARTNSLSLDVFTEIVKSCASISGHVGGTGIIPEFGFVYSIGPQAFSFLDSSGNYRLPKIFKSHYLPVVAVWWIQEGGKLVRHREVREISFFNGDLTNFNFGEVFLPTPTPTFPPPSDPYYDKISGQIIDQKLTWQEEGIQKTVSWLNGMVPELPLPSEIAEAIQEAKVDEYDPYTMRFFFKNGVKVSVSDPAPPTVINSSLQNSEPYNKASTTIIANSSQPTTVKNNKVLMLGPNAFEDKLHKDDMFVNVKSLFKDTCGYEVRSLGVINYSLSQNFPGTPDSPNTNNPSLAEVQFSISNTDPKLVECEILPGMEDKVPKPWDFVGMNNYGVIYIATHGAWYELMACPYYRNDSILAGWVNSPDNQGYWSYAYIDFSILYPDEMYGLPNKYFKAVCINTFYLGTYNDDFSGSLVYISACDTWHLPASGSWGLPRVAFSNPKVYIAPSEKPKIKYMSIMAYDFFMYMLADPAMSAKNAYTQMINDHPGYQNQAQLQIYTGVNNENDSTYLPGYITVIVHKK